MEVEQVFESSTASIGAARHFARETLETWERPDLLEPVALLVSELVGNAVLHADSPATVRMTLHQDCLHVEVSDGSTEPPALRPLEVDAPSGRGLRIVDAIAERWGVRTVPGGKSVWFELSEDPLRDDQRAR